MFISRNIINDYLSFRSSPWAHLDFHRHVDDFIADVPQSVTNELCFWLTTPPSEPSLLANFLLSLLHIFFAVSEETNSKGMMIEGLEQQNFLTRYNVLNLNKVVKINSSGILIP